MKGVARNEKSYGYYDCNYYADQRINL